MPKKSGFEFMMNFIQEYLDGTTDRLSWDLNFNHYLIQQYPKMERENRELADCFYFYLSEEGSDQGEELSDSAHKKLIRKQWREFKAAMKDGIY
jgi:hypothetical protein